MNALGRNANGVASNVRCRAGSVAPMSAPIGPYTPARRVGDLLFCSGQIGKDGDVLAEGLGAQARQTIANLEALLKENGASLDQVIKTTVFLTDMAAYSMMNEIYGELFSAPHPARSAVAVAALPAGAEIEIEAIAYVG